MYSKVLIVLLFFNLQLKAQVSYPQKIQNHINVIKNYVCLKSADLGFVLVDPDSNKIIASLNPEKSLSPASCLKIITTSAALNFLGEDYRFKTSLAISGEIKDSTLNGNVYIIGGGDPTLGYNRALPYSYFDSLLNNWAFLLKKHGINYIKGEIVGDDSHFDYNTIPLGWDSIDLGNYYGAGAGGLMIHENLYSVILKPGKVEGEQTTFLHTDIDVGIEVTNHCLTGKVGSGDHCNIVGNPYEFVRTLKGTIPAGVDSFIVKGSIPDPALYFANLLRKYLERKGISCMGVTTQRILKYDGTGKRTVISQYYSPPLSKIVYHCNQRSVNLYAEAILKECGFVKYGVGNYESGIRAIKEYWNEAGVDTTFHMTDGCGMSSANSVSALQLASILVKQSKSSNFLSFKSSLPIAGVSGTMTNTCKTGPACNNVCCKTGSINNVLNYAGFVKNKEGKTVCFVLMFNNFKCGMGDVKKVAEGLMGAMAE